MDSLSKNQTGATFAQKVRFYLNVKKQNYHTPHPHIRILYYICETKDQSLTFQMVHKCLFSISNLFSYSGLKRCTYIHFPKGAKKHFNKVMKVCFFTNKQLTNKNATSI